jgi:Cof subfamily protein (haloacid dehalogenase superfamily)
MKILYVTDLDGTLLNNKAQLTKYTINVINELINKGMCFSYATARSLSSASMVTNGLITNIPVITKNGIFIENAYTNEKIYSLSFSENEKQILIDIMEKCQIYPMVYAYINGNEKKSWVGDMENDAMKDKINSSKDDPRLRPVKKGLDLYSGELYEINCVGKKDDLIDVYNYLKETDKFTCLLQKEYYSEHYWCEILPKKATKGNTVLVLKEKLKCDRIISFGDAINDIPMFKISDESYAVENAEDELKGYATGIIMSNDNDGVANWLTENYNKIRSNCT